MEIAPLNQLKKELKTRSHDEILAISLRLAKYKKENKELLHYLLLESHDESNYIELIKSDIIEGFKTINDSNLYYAKKGIRRTLKVATKHVRYSGEKQTEVEVLTFFCQQMIAMDVPIQKSKVLVNILNNQLRKIDKALSVFHEDLQYDYNQTLESVRIWVEKFKEI